MGQKMEGFDFRTVAELIVSLCAFGSALLSFLNRHSIREVKLSLNSRLDQLLKVSTEAAFSKGHAIGLVQSTEVEGKVDDGLFENRASRT